MRQSLFSNIFLAFFVLAVAVMLLVPLPVALLDLLLAINIAFSFLLLLVGLYMPNALALLSFPSILLLTTLFRLGLNVASTRLILSLGEAGQIIEAFGNFLIQGEVVVGAIIFIIITVVNFIVIARGASRVSEVSARFALDALPGKQMAIDADLRSGVIDVSEAERRRDELRKESQLYGSMDGAMKFVQGDAIAGLFIIFTNIIGGMYIGIQRGLNFGDAIQTYTTLTIGDGLVSQIPALLISICAGIVVTRVSSGKNTTLGSDISAQLFSNPFLLWVTSFVLFIIAFLPGVPAMPFILVAMALFATGVLIRNSARPQVVAGMFSSTENVKGIKLISSSLDEQLRLPDQKNHFSLLLGKQLFQLYEQRSEYYLSCWEQVQESIYLQAGIKIDNMTFLRGLRLDHTSFEFEIGDTSALTSKLRMGSLFVDTSPVSAEVYGFDVLAHEYHPIFDYSGVWVPASQDQRKLADAGGIRYYDALEFALLCTHNFLHKHPEELLGISDMQNLLKIHEKNHPGITAQVLIGNYITLSRLAEIFQQLLKEGIAVREYRYIFELVANYCSTYRNSMVNNDDFDLDDIVGFIRLKRKRVVLDGLISERSTVRAVKMSAGVQSLFEQARYDSHLKQLALDNQISERLLLGLSTLLEPVNVRGMQPICIITPADLRHKTQTFLGSYRKKIRVIAHEEIDSSYQIDTVGYWSEN